MTNAQNKIHALLNQLVDVGREHGVQVAAYLDGKLVVDTWAGVADSATGRLVDGETLFPVFSCTKGILATLIHRLVELGKLSYETRIAEVWPEFGANGKEEITLDQALWHTSAIPYVPNGVEVDDLHDWPGMCDVIAGLKPAWEPGTRAEYHAVTFGWILGEVARRADGRPVQQQVREEICRPLNIDSLFIGIPDEVEPRVAILEDASPPPSGPEPSQPQIAPFCREPLHSYMNRPDARRACLPASSGIMNARALARFYAALLPGGVDGVELLPPERIRKATEWQKAGQAWNPACFPLRVGGYMLFGEVRTESPAFGHDGFGGACGFADPKHNLSIGLTKNFFSPNGAQNLIVTELQSTLAPA